MNAQQYDETIRRLQAAGAGAPRGRLYHVCFGEANKLQVFDVWDSQESFDAFGKVLMPILTEIGLDPGQPMIEPVFAQMKFNRGLDRFRRRGRGAVRTEWRLITATHNLLKLHRHTLAAA